jgi:hypothetical protein
MWREHLAASPAFPVSRMLLAVDLYCKSSTQ